MFLLTGILGTLVIVLLAAYLWYVRSAFNFFTRLNIPGPRPTFIFGNFLDIIKSRRLSLTLHEWTRKYGRVFGFFEGTTPILVVSDPDILQEVFIKSFSNFHSRRAFPLEERHTKQVHVFSATGYRWKRQRFVINPTFSSVKLKQMTPLVHRSLSTFMSKMTDEQAKGEPFDIYAYLKRFTMDTIWSCGFGLDTDMQNNANDPYLTYSQELFLDKIRLDILVALLFQELLPFWSKLHRYASATRYWLRSNIPLTKALISEDPTTWIVNKAKTLIDKRQKIGQTNRIDLLQLMLESASDEDFIQDRTESFVGNDETTTEVQLVRKLTKHEIAANVFLFSEYS